MCFHSLVTFLFSNRFACWPFTVRSRLSGEPSAAELLRTGFQKAFHHFPQAGGHREGMLRSWRLVIHKIWFYVLYESPKSSGIVESQNPETSRYPHVSKDKPQNSSETWCQAPLFEKKMITAISPTALPHVVFSRGFPKV